MPASQCGRLNWQHAFQVFCGESLVVTEVDYEEFYECQEVTSLPEQRP